jgi:hypothetical protein
VEAVGVYAWVKDLLAAWGGESLVLPSPMPIEVLRRWLGVGSSDKVRRAAAQLNTRAGWRPVLRGRLLPAGSGSQFVGVLGWDPMLKALTCCVFTSFAAAFLTGVTFLIVSAAKQASLLMPALGVTAFGLFGMVTAVVSTLVGYRETRGQAAYLRSWITGQMAMEWFGERVAPED